MRITLSRCRMKQSAFAVALRASPLIYSSSTELPHRTRCGPSLVSKQQILVISRLKIVSCDILAEVVTDPVSCFLTTKMCVDERAI